MPSFVSRPPRLSLLLTSRRSPLRTLHGSRSELEIRNGWLGLMPGFESVRGIRCSHDGQVTFSSQWRATWQVKVFENQRDGSGFSWALWWLSQGACCFSWMVRVRLRQLSQRKAEENGVRKKFALIDASAPTSRPLCLGRVRTDPSCFLNYMHVTNPSVDTLLSAK
jgi:hypothetical protein